MKLRLAWHPPDLASGRGTAPSPLGAAVADLGPGLSIESVLRSLEALPVPAFLFQPGGALLYGTPLFVSSFGNHPALPSWLETLSALEPSLPPSQLTLEGPGGPFLLNLAPYPLPSTSGTSLLLGLLQPCPVAQDASPFTRAILDHCGALVAVIDHNNRLLLANRTASDLLGFPAGLPLGAHLPDLLLEGQEHTHALILLDQLRLDLQPRQGHAVLRSAAGRLLPVAWTATPLLSSPGAPPQIILLARDHSALNRLQRRRRWTRAELRAIWESCTDALVFLDSDHHIVAANPSFCTLVHTRRGAVEGCTLPEVLRPVSSNTPDSPRSLEEFELPSGERRWLEITRTPLHAPARADLLLMVLRDSTDRVRSELELRESNRHLEATTQLAHQLADRARASSAAKSAFLASVSHEFRTPLNAILGMSDLALSSPLNPDLREYLELIRSSADALLALVDDILDLSKAEANRIEIRPTPFDLPALLLEVLRPLAYQAKARALLVESHLHPALPQFVVSDPARLRQILVNLLGNAIKFTDSGSIRLQVDPLDLTPSSALVRFLVVDTGPGIPPASQSRIFDSFVQLDQSSTRQIRGTGLGLAISARLVSLLGGRLFLSSQPGQGSTFAFTLPLACPPSAPPPSGLEASRPLRLLVAEDNPVNRRLLDIALSRAGHSADFAANGQEAVTAAARARYDAILMDVEMPLLDGLQATSLIRRAQAPSASRTPIVAMTAHSGSDFRHACFEAGMDAFLSKPVRLREMLRTIEVLVLGAQPEAPDGSGEPTTNENSPMKELDYHAALDRVGGDASLLGELAGLFLEEYPQLLDAVRQGLAAGDTHSAYSAAHQLKGLLAQFGGEAARLKAFAVESAAKAGDLGSALAAFPDLESIMTRLHPELVEMASGSAPS